MRSLGRAGVADRFARRVEARGHGRIGNDSALPNGVDQLILADDPAAVSDEMDKEVENLWFERDQIAGVTQFAPFDIEYVVTERECHR